MSDLRYSGTRKACYVGYITQAIVVNLAPLFYLIFQKRFQISRTEIGQLVLVMFLVQLAVDLLSVKFIRILGYRTACVAAHALAAAGLVLLSFLPFVIHPYAGIIISIVVSSVGSGLIEVMISPIIEAIPGDSSKTAMAFLHSFYCWGQAGVVLITTLVLLFVGNDRWNLLPLVWAVIPFCNMIAFIRVPITDIDGDEPVRIRELVSSPMFILAFAVMICSGASELAMSQWASYFAEAGLGVTKVVGDLLGPCLFAVFMAVGRTVFGIFGERVSLKKCLVACGLITVASYLIAVFAPFPIMSLFGCSLCGLGVSLLWPGMLSLSARRFPHGGTALFALLALGGDIGCSLGPYITGRVSDAVTSFPAFEELSGVMGIGIEQLSVKLGLLTVIIFPVFAVIGVLALGRTKRDKK